MVPGPRNVEKVEKTGRLAARQARIDPGGVIHKPGKTDHTKKALRPKKY